MTKPTTGSRRLRGMRRLPALLLPLMLLIVAACSAAPGASSPASAESPSASPPATVSPSISPSLPVESSRPSASLSAVPGIGTVYSGILSMDAIEGGCVYLQAAGGRKLQVLYPDGWSISKDPLELTAPDGSVHSRGGDRVTIRGSEATDMASICQIGPIIQATEVLGP